MKRLAVLVVMAGCAGPEVEATWLEGFGYGWTVFNHRVSYVGVSVGDRVANIGVVGGTSTTGVAADLPEGCDPSTCTEYPFYDEAEATVHWGHVVTRRAVFGTGSTELAVGSAGDTTTVEVPLSSKGKGNAIAILSGLTVDTDEALASGESCYRPEYGWHPRNIAVSLGDPTLSDDGESASVEVTAAFRAGASLEEVRECVDAVVDDAVVKVRVDVLVAVGGGEATKADVAHGLVYEWDGSGDPPEQPDPSPAERPYDAGIDPTRAMVGWSALDFDFHLEVDPGRGAYLRTWSFVADPTGGSASGHATNYSPGTQIAGFDYTFAGTVRALDLRADVERGVLDVLLPERIDESGAPRIDSFDL